MDIKALLIKAGFTEKTVAKDRFLKAPSDDYAVWYDEKELTGGDDYICLAKHTYTVEIYLRQKNTNLDRLFAKELQKAGFSFKQSETVWLEADQINLIQFEIRTLEKEKV